MGDNLFFSIAKVSSILLWMDTHYRSDKSFVQAMNESLNISSFHHRLMGEIMITHRPWPSIIIRNNEKKPFFNKVCKPSLGPSVRP